MTNKSSQLILSADISAKLTTIYQKKGIIAVDTELHGLKLFRDEICLIQLCDDDNNVALVQPTRDNKSGLTNLKKILEDPNIIKIFHFALTDVAFFKTSLNIEVKNFCCTKVMSKMIRTYTDRHGLKSLTAELMDIELQKEQQQTDWSKSSLTQEQLKYAAADVIYLVEIYQKLVKMIEDRPTLSTGDSIKELNTKAQNILPSLIDLIINGYGDSDRGWQTNLFSH